MQAQGSAHREYQSVVLCVGTFSVLGDVLCVDVRAFVSPQSGATTIPNHALEL
jgi:hypothetical protein